MDSYPQKSVLWRAPLKKAFDALLACATILGASIAVSMWLSEASIQYELCGYTDLLDVNRAIDGLVIKYNDEDLIAKGIDLKIGQMRVTNVGSENIVQEHFSKEDKWGLSLSNGKIIEARLLNTNSNHIRKWLRPTVAENKSNVYFSEIMFDSGDYFTIEIVFRYALDDIPDFKPIGKISGIASNKLVAIDEGDIGKSFFEEFFNGGVLVNIARYGTSLCFAIAIVIGAYNYRRSRKIARGMKSEESRRRDTIARQTQVERAVTTMTDEERKAISYVANLYVNYGETTLLQLNDLLGHEESVAILVAKMRETHLLEGGAEKSRAELVEIGGFTDLLEELLKRELVVDMDGNMGIDPVFKRSSRHFLDRILASSKTNNRETN